MHDLTGNTLPLIQAPMAGVQGSALARAVCAAGGLGSLPCAMLAPDALRRELDALRAGTAQAFNLNFFCHAPPEADARREQACATRSRRTTANPDSTRPGFRPVPAECRSTPGSRT